MSSLFLQSLFQSFCRKQAHTSGDRDHCLDIIAAHFRLPRETEPREETAHMTLEDAAASRHLLLERVSPLQAGYWRSASLPLLARYPQNIWRVMYWRAPAPSDTDAFEWWQCFPAPYSTVSPVSLTGLVLASVKQKIFLLAGTNLLASLGPLFIALLSVWLFALQGWIAGSDYVFFFVAAWLVLVAFSCVSFFNDCLGRWLNARLLLHILPGVWSRLLECPEALLREIRPAELTERMMAFESALSSVLSRGLALLFDAIAILLLLIFLVCCNQRMGLVSVCLCGVMILMKGSLLPRYRKLLAGQGMEQGRVSGFLQEVLLQMQKIRSAHAENRLYQKWLARMRCLKQQAEQVAVMDLLFSLADPLFSMLLLLSLYGVVALQGRENGTAGFLSCLMLTVQLAGWLEKFSIDSLSFCQLLPSLQRIAPLLQQNAVSQERKGRTIVLKGALKLENISLKTETGRILFDQVQFEAAPGEFVAITGPSGAGKSTLLKLMLGLVLPDHGKIFVDDENISYLNPRILRSQFGVVLQTTSLLPGSIYSNLAVTSSMTLEEALKLADLVGLREDIESMPMKLFTHVSDNASESLSGGQRQKLLLARALATQPKILLLDEATSALDTISEAHLHATLDALKITRIVVAHRPASLLAADRIYRLENGRLLETGSL